MTRSRGKVSPFSATVSKNVACLSEKHQRDGKTFSFGDGAPKEMFLFCGKGVELARSLVGVCCKTH